IESRVFAAIDDVPRQASNGQVRLAREDENNSNDEQQPTNKNQHAPKVAHGSIKTDGCMRRHWTQAVRGAKSDVLRAFDLIEELAQHQADGRIGYDEYPLLRLLKSCLAAHVGTL